MDSTVMDVDNIPVPAAVQVNTYYAVVATLTYPMNSRSMQPP
jgi:hypothetical protein